MKLCCLWTGTFFPTCGKDKQSGLAVWAGAKLQAPISLAHCACPSHLSSQTGDLPICRSSVSSPAARTISQWSIQSPVWAGVRMPRIHFQTPIVMTWRRAKDEECTLQGWTSCQNASAFLSTQGCRESCGRSVLFVPWATLSLFFKVWDQPRCLSTHEQIKKM